MASILRKTLLYLGLAPDSEYEDMGHYEDDPAVESATRLVPPQPVKQPATAGAPSSVQDHDDGGSAIRTISPVSTPTVAGSAGSPTVRIEGEQRTARPSVVRPLPVARSSRPHKVAPQSFDDAQLIADRYKNSQAVIVNLQGVDQSLGRRIIDFASGLCYGIGGQMERVANHVYLLTPADVEVSDDIRADLDGSGD
jgi:cell division inhibitor SepF